ncbi:cuticlin-4 [Periplaneta americana]|uniref:cuticlin-4 n=1 Tax=Periplaneta americana TaxID=6978 RepID=UPI0037E95845
MSLRGDAVLWLGVLLSCGVCVQPQQMLAPRRPNMVTGVNVTCSSGTLTVQTQLERPFHGLLYARGFPLECKAQGTGDSLVTLHLPATQCGVRVVSGEAGLLYAVVVEVQMDRHLQQVADQQRAVTCRLPAEDTTPARPSARMARKKADMPSADYQQQSTAQAWLEIRGQDSTSQVSVGEETTLLVKALLPAGLGTRVTDCVAHDGAGESSQRLLDEWGCPIDELILPALNPIPWDGARSKLKLQVAGATFAAFKFPDRSSLHIHCSLQLCHGSCLKVDCSLDGKSSARNSRKLKGEVLDHLEVFNSIEVVAPGIEIDDMEDVLSSDAVAPSSHPDHALCLSPPKMALAFALLGLVFLAAAAVGLLTLLRGHRRRDEETLIVQDSPFLGRWR